MKTSPMRTFDPRKVAYLEKEAWVAYYQKRWLRLLQVLIELVETTFGLSFVQALWAGYLNTRAQLAFAPFPNNNVPRAEEYMRRFYAYVKNIHRENFDERETAHLEVNWWVVHRQLFGQTENQALVDAVADLYASAYQVARAQVYPAAYHRAQAMIYSDAWVKSERASDSPLLKQEEEELFNSYAALRQAVQIEGGT